MKPHYKLIASVESSLFKVEMQEGQKAFDYPWHYHPEYELTYILQGRGVRYVGNNIENFFEDDFVMLGANLPHAYINTPGHEVPVKAIVVYLKEDFIKILSMQRYEFERINILLSLSGKGIKFDYAKSRSLKNKMIELLGLPPFEKLIMLLEILQELTKPATSHLLCNPGFSYELILANNQRINSVYQFIRKNYQRRITLAEIASVVNMNEAYFSRFFSKTMKKSFVEFLNEYRINSACRQLIETDMQVAEVCYASGFESISYFYRQFKRIKHCQPISYRSIYQNAAPMVQVT